MKEVSHSNMPRNEDNKLNTRHPRGMEKMGSMFAGIEFLFHVQAIHAKWGTSTAGEPERGVMEACHLHPRLGWCAEKASAGVFRS